MFGPDERRWEVGEVLTILTHTSPQIGPPTPPSGGWGDKGRNEKPGDPQ